MKLFNWIFLLAVIFCIISCKKGLKKDSDSYNFRHENCKGLEIIERLECMKGSDCPLFEMRTINDNQIVPSDFDDEIVVINFWATYCKPCIAEIPGLNDLKIKYDNVNFIAVNIDKFSELLNFLKINNFNFEMVSDESNKIGRDIFKNDMGIPLTVIIKDGKIEKMICGGSTDEFASEIIKNEISSIIEASL
jgi:thiol-disulfide isomerase/thioredoxin